MWLARYFPGLGLSVDDVDDLTPEQTDQLRKVGRKLLNSEADERLAHTRVIAAAAGIRLQR
jgi:hypothetical protein